MSGSARIQRLGDITPRLPEHQVPGAITGEKMTIVLRGPRVAAVDWLRDRGVVRVMAVGPVAVDDTDRAAVQAEVTAINSVGDGPLLVVRGVGVFAEVILYMDPDYSISGGAFDHALAFVMSAMEAQRERLCALSTRK